MTTLLILGSKPEPAIPPRSEWDDLACANASGHIAAGLGLPDPVFTAVTALLVSGCESGRQSMRAMQGLHTGALFFLRSSSRKTSLRQPNPLKFLRALPKAFRVSPLYFKWAMSRAGYRWERFVDVEVPEFIEATVAGLPSAGELIHQATHKRPSTGLTALLIGLSLNRYDRFILSGFSFELTHAYAHNPEIDRRGTKQSAHAPTDVLFLQRLAAALGNLYTTEETVHRAAGLPLLELAHFSP